MKHLVSIAIVLSAMSVLALGCATGRRGPGVGDPMNVRVASGAPIRDTAGHEHRAIERPEARGGGAHTFRDEPRCSPRVCDPF